jgi:hypothetical protein
VEAGSEVSCRAEGGRRLDADSGQEVSGVVKFGVVKREESRFEAVKLEAVDLDGSHPVVKGR